jgi:hypothetical protein
MHMPEPVEQRHQHVLVAAGDDHSAPSRFSAAMA